MGNGGPILFFNMILEGSKNSINRLQLRELLLS